MTIRPELIEIAVPRDRQASFEPQFIQKHQTRLDGFEDKILSLCACGMTTRDIQAQVQDLSGVEVSPTFISTIKVTHNHRIFPSDEAVFKVVYLAIQNIAKKWTIPIHNWKPALHCFAIEFAGRLPQ